MARGPRGQGGRKTSTISYKSINTKPNSMHHISQEGGEVEDYIIIGYGSKHRTIISLPNQPFLLQLHRRVAADHSS